MAKPGKEKERENIEVMPGWKPRRVETPKEMPQREKSPQREKEPARR